ncbi:MAG: peptidase S8, partial [Polyangiaceae bacterium]
GVSYIKAARQPTTKCGSIPSGFGLNSGDSIKSCDGRFELVMQSDGNLVMYQGSKALWSAGTSGKHAYKAELQGDGNFVIYDGKGDALWNSGTGGHAGAGLDLQTDGNMVIYASAGHAIWSTGTR